MALEEGLVLPWIEGDRVVAAAIEESGTVRVKRYRLVPPGDPPAP